MSLWAKVGAQWATCALIMSTGSVLSVLSGIMIPPSVSRLSRGDHSLSHRRTSLSLCRFLIRVGGVGVVDLLLEGRVDCFSIE